MSNFSSSQSLPTPADSNKTKPSQLILVATDIRSTHNVGSLFRSAEGFGASLALVGITPYPQQTNDPRLPHIARKTTEAIAKTALGAEKLVSWRTYPDLSTCIKQLKNDGYQVIALEQHDTSQPLMQLTLTQPLAIVLGREVEGLSVDEIALCDECYEIPMMGKKESYNVSVAAGIALYQARCLNR